ncbi:MAG: cupin [Anaerolineae bacterium]|nr:cupin [Anaerolineae bacterium]
MNLNYSHIPNLLEQIPDIPSNSIVSRTFYQDERMKAILFGFAAGQELSEHTASQSAILYILQGEAGLTLGDDSMEAQAGTWVYMPPRLPHSLYAKTPVLMLLLLFKEPK